ncbi:long-chain-fatty-acid--CoA ligase [Halalkalibacter akibai]|uniref:Long-chain-fatty-acid-CoA ligase n=1 Tax=Halalkalibacter akibai (strain ATCC 43226 / DSM 21942 / CIP 109018 / JCM 9157 / 1139) TaxID=1236973 RepID=W4QS05_HALA3|nr:long-chain-fatty-acid--CoA ligase [Halalkalibacter akibai]GAE34881.1 long-chain-fatty-acid-CoA ligase [Halalkalibacter akibai JCM 9157]
MTTVEKIWLDHYPEEVPHSIEYDERCLHDYLKISAEKYSTNTALHFLGKDMTFTELYEQAKQFANQLQTLGVKKGDRVAIMLANCPQGVISYYGALMVGAVVVQTNPLYVERELEHQLVDSGAKVIICLDLVFPRVEKVRSKTKLEHVIVTSIKDYLPFPKNLLYPFVQKKNTGIKVDIEYNNKTIAFKPFLKAGKATEVHVDMDPVSDLALLQYTGGTTGPAKGVMLTHQNLVVNTLQCIHWTYKVTPGEERGLAVLPFFHVYGMTVSMNLGIMNGHTTVILPKFDPKDVLKTIEKQKITLFPGAPTMYVALINDPSIKEHNLSSIKACLSGAAPLPLEVQQKFEKLTGGKLVEGYGLTETSPVAISTPIWGKRKTGSVGIPWPDTEAAVLSAETGEPAEIGEVGEIAIRGPQVMKGYWNRPEETAKVFKEDWFLTGDMGYMDEEGYFFIVDRKKDMIIAGGFNIYPREIEEVLYEHEAIQEAVVIGVPDEYRGETVKAFVVLKEGKNLTEKELDEYCRKNLAAFKVPRLYEYRQELPKTLVGKILRRVLVEEEKQKQVPKEKVSNE